ncbi:DHX8 [Symbiodinium natans]|uniref:RNA helicase n=1 Tax=Symbiodinium natans TaxID=878477 RepID=A0A812MTS9_9DINO|nr:DHX8 [Symbiodinium natans]
MDISPTAKRRRQASKPDLDASAQLPIGAFREDIVKAVQQHRVVVLVGETGSGKTTQVPRFLYEAGLSRRPDRAQQIIAVTQPRRIAAISVANHVASEMGCQVGGLVGYHVRFLNRTSRETVLKYMTDGMLVRESAWESAEGQGHHSGLRACSIVVLDEAHERSIDTDILLGLVKQALEKGEPPDLRVVVMSATIHAAPFVDFFGGSKEVHLLKVPGRQHAVQLYYTPSPEPDILEAAMLAVLQLHVTRPAGDVLVFLPGQEEIDGLQRLLEEKQDVLAKQRQDHPEKRILEVSGDQPGAFATHAWPTFQTVLNIFVRPIYAALPFEQQEQVFEATPPGCRKVVLATNIAETSITIPGIRYVVDTGIMKLKMCHPQTGIEMLRTVETSQASAIQRAGRAGREAPGEVFRLYVESDYQKMPVQTPAEILRLEMASVYINLKALGISKIASFPLVDRPSREALEKAAHFLCRIGALDSRDALTDLGRKLAAVPVHPMYAYCLHVSLEFECVAEILSIVALMSADAQIFTTSKKQRAQQAKPFHEDGDHLSLLSAFSQWRKEKKPKAYAAENSLSHSALEKAETIRKQLKERMQQAWHANISSCGGPKNWVVVKRCLLKGLFLQTAMRDEVNQTTYRTLLSRQEAKLHPSSVLHRRQPSPPCVVYSELVMTSKSYLRTVTEASVLFHPTPQSTPIHLRKLSENPSFRHTSAKG